MSNTRYAIELQPRPGIGGSPTLLVDMLTSAEPTSGHLRGDQLDLSWDADGIVARQPRETPVRIDRDNARRIQVSRVPGTHEIAVTIDTEHRTGLVLTTRPDPPWLADGLPELAAAGVPVEWSVLRQLASLAVHLGARVSRMPLRRRAPSAVPTPRRVHHGNCWTVVDEEGQSLAPQGDEADLEHVSPYSEGLAAMCIDGRWGYLDRFGHRALGPQFREVQSFTSGFAAVSRDEGAWSFIDRAGRWRMSRRYAGAQPFSEGLAAVCVDEQWGYIDANDNWAIPPRFDSAGPFTDGLAVCSWEGRFGLVDRKGAWRVAPAYDHAFRPGDGLVAVRRGATWGFVSYRGATVIPTTLDAPGRFEDGVCTLVSGVQIDTSGRVLGERTTERHPSGLRLEHVDDRVRFVPAAERPGGRVPGVCALELDEARPFRCGLAAARRDAGWGFVDCSGIWLADVAAPEVGDFHEGLAAVRDPDDELWRFVGLDGEAVTEDGFVEVGAFREGIAPVRVEGGWRMLTSTGSLLGPVVDALRPMHEGWSAARVGVYWGALDIQGKWGLAPGMAALGGLRDGVARARIANRWSKIVVPHWWLSWTRESE